MNNLRDYYERALQEFGTSDDGELKEQESERKVVLVKNIYSQYLVIQVSRTYLRYLSRYSCLV